MVKAIVVLVLFIQISGLAKTCCADDTKPTAEKATSIQGIAWFNVRTPEGHIRYTGVDHRDLTVADMATIAAERHLEGLSLQDCRIPDGGFAAFRDDEKLRGLSMMDSQVSALGMSEIGNALPNLTYLSLHGTKLSEGHLRAIGNLRSLEDLNLSWTSTTGDWLVRLKECDDLKRLILAGISMSLAAAEHLAQHDSLDILSLTDARGITVPVAAEIAKIASLTTVYLSRSDVQDLGVAELARLPQLQYLAINETKVSDEGLAEFANSKSLRTLICHKMAVTWTGLRQIATNVELTRIVVDDRLWTDRSEFEVDFPDVTIERWLIP